jgi:hypothetical protein
MYFLEMGCGYGIGKKTRQVRKSIGRATKMSQGKIGIIRNVILIHQNDIYTQTMWSFKIEASEFFFIFFL